MLGFARYNPTLIHTARRKEENKKPSKNILHGPTIKLFLSLVTRQAETKGD